MADIKVIIAAIDKFLERKQQETTTPIEINPYLEKLGLLRNSNSRNGKPIREILRDGKIPHAYQIGTNWFIPHSGKTYRKPLISKHKIPNTASYEEIIITKHKLIPIADVVINLIEKKYKKRPKYLLEHKPNWLLSNPTTDLIEKHPELSDLYSLLTTPESLLKEKILELSDKNKTQKQSFDIWIGEPFNFAIEFDEKQHFNQFRKMTLDFYNQIKIKFPLNLYKQLNDNIKINPGNSGFTKLKSIDILFPEILVGEKQDNRVRQRAFRDFMKDLLPVEYGYSPTLRIPYHVTDKNISNFTNIELINIEKYLIDNDLI
jgi:hypothetical protein